MKFQFLLVRLKASSVMRRGRLYMISIPTGTIKRVKRCDVEDEVETISIPTGTIKRESCTAREVLYAQFQFLLVRLKGILYSTGGIVCSISIPTGTIKSPTKLRKTASEKRFQFLLVRLKEISVCYQIRILRKFQFLLVRLKDIERLQFEAASGGFQFLLVRLKGLSRSNGKPLKLHFNSYWYD